MTEILFSDKTGTLPFNKPQLGDPIVAPGYEGGNEEMKEWAALSCQRRHADTFDQILLAAVDSVENLDRKYQVLECATLTFCSCFPVLLTFFRLYPFDSTTKRSEATVRRLSDDVTFRVTKGAPSVLLYVPITFFIYSS